MKNIVNLRVLYCTFSILFVGAGVLTWTSGCGDDDDNNCIPDCTGIECGDDGCGGSCGTCEEGECVEGVCEEPCVPDCSGRECGPDPVCGEDCPPGCNEGETCNEEGQCIEAEIECGVQVELGTGAEKVVATIEGSDFQVDGSGIDQTVEFTTDEQITGVGFTALWSGVVADEANGTAPWSLDLGAVVTAPDNSTLEWNPIGGEISTADYPLQDFIHGFDCVDGNGTFTWTFTSVEDPWVAGLSDVRYHLTTEVPKVEQVFDGSIDSGPTWTRPFSMVGVSGLGEVVYNAMSFTVSVSGGYEIETVVDAGDTFNYIYKGSFDPENPLENLLDYGLGNGYSYYELPAGTAFMSVLLFEDETYHVVVSQWSPTSPGEQYVTTVTGPGLFITE